MDKSVKRAQYIKEFNQFIEKVKLNDKFMSKLRKHEFFGEHLKNIEEYKDDLNKKVYIFLELTKERKSCEAIVEILRESDQRELAVKLEEYNTSPGLIDILNASTEICIPVETRKIPRGPPYSNNFPMIKDQRGRCILINNEPLTRNETLRFKHVFSELYFDVQDYNNKSIAEIKQLLNEISEDKSLKEDNALVVVIMAHGRDEKIYGYKDNEHITVKEIVEPFSYDPYDKLKSKEHLKDIPKIFIIDSCRPKCENPSVEVTSLATEEQQTLPLTENLTVYKTKEKNDILLLELSFTDKTWVQQNRDTFIINSCSEGYYSHWLEKEIDWNQNQEKIFATLGMSAFAQAFTHAIARYACDESLQSILGRTNTLMEQFEKIKKYSAPQLTGQSVKRELYFNPGYPERK